MDTGGSVWATELILLRSNFIKLQNKFQEKYPLFFQLNIYTHYGKSNTGGITFPYAVTQESTAKDCANTELRTVGRIVNVAKPLLQISGHIYF
jgi:uncharacterized protein (DUF39 family)